jgi:hypothetical protein
MAAEINQEMINDAAKLIMHRLIARALARDPALVERAKAVHARNSDRYPGHGFVHDWDELLQLPPERLRVLVTSRDREMYRLRVSSPFYLAGGVDFTDESLRRRIRRAARRVVERGLGKGASAPTLAA